MPDPYTAVDLDDPLPVEEQAIIDDGWAEPFRDVFDRYVGSVPGVPCQCGHLVSMHRDDQSCEVCDCEPCTHRSATQVWELTDPPRPTGFRCVACGETVTPKVSRRT